ncbi:hypothetical protein BS17DRAFT_788691, partial [Gyrodon lividus]
MYQDSRVDSEAQISDVLPASMYNLPVELLHQVIGFLDIVDILTLRKTCKYLSVLSRERSLWTALFNRMRATQPLPYSRSEFEAMSAPEIERVLLTAFEVEKSFLVPRERMGHIIPTSKQDIGSLCYLVFVLDRFVLSADNTTVISLWDASELPSSTIIPSYPRARLSLPTWTLLAHSLSPDNSILYIAVSSHQRARIYAIPLDSNAPNANKYELAFNLTADFDMHMTDAIRCMDPDSSLVLLYHTATSVDVLNWRTNSRATITIDDVEEVWNGVTTLRFCGPYILCFRVHSIEAYPLPAGFSNSATTRPGSLPVLRHRFPAVTFRRVSLSHLRSSHCPSGDVYTVFMLANDLFEGTFHYQVNVKTIPAPSISITPLAMRGLYPPNAAGDDRGRHPPFGVGIGGAFVSAWALGSVGLRGVWVDRQRGDMVRRVVAFTACPSRLRPGEHRSREGTWNESAADAAPYFDGRVVLSIPSYDLRGWCYFAPGKRICNEVMNF